MIANLTVTEPSWIAGCDQLLQLYKGLDEVVSSCVSRMAPHVRCVGSDFEAVGYTEVFGYHASHAGGALGYAGV